MQVLILAQTLARTDFLPRNHLLWQRILQAPACFHFEELTDNGIEGHHCRLGLGSNIIPVTDIYRTAIQLFLAYHYPHAVGG